MVNSAISLSSQITHCFNNVILHLNKNNFIKPPSFEIILESLRPSFSDEGTFSVFSVRVRGKPWKQLIDVHENSGLNRQKKKHSMARVSGNSCNPFVTGEGTRRNEFVEWHVAWLAE